MTPRQLPRTFASLLLTIGAFLGAAAQEAVNWSFRLVDNATDHPAIEIRADIQPGYHLFSVDNPEGGSLPLSFRFDLKGASLQGKPEANKKYVSEYDDIFEVDQHFYTGSVTFLQKLKPAAPSFTVNVEVKGQACNDGGCVPVFAQRSLSGTAPVAPPAKAEGALKDDKAEAADEPGQPSPEQAAEEAEPAIGADNPNPPFDSKASWWDNVEAELKSMANEPQKTAYALLYILIAGFIGGLIALLTPCVWPMIPMTVSFFLKHNKSRAKSIRTAAIYGLSIIVIYVGLGLLITVLFGASALNELATSAVFNIIFFLLLVVFAVSFLGAFELTLPAKWTDRMDAKVDATAGLLSVFFMAFTLVLVSFSCTGPIIGTLLVEAAVSSDFLAPLIGMFGFALALALPFSLFAIFPTMLKAMPRSGGWLNSVKVVLGFLELALALKFLSVADLAYGWRILDREVFVALWIVIFTLLGLYLLGKITFPHDDKPEHTGVGRFMLACISLAFAVYMLPGLWGAPLKAISAFAPPISTQDFSLFEGDVAAQVNDYEEGMELAARLGKPVLVDFSGHGCVNCRKMEAAVWTDPEVKRSIDEDFVLVTLMVDEKKPLPQPIEITENGQKRTLRTVGDKWSYLQRSKFGANAQPYHVILDAKGKPLAAPFVYKEDVPAYKAFLETGKRNNSGASRTAK